MNKRFLSAIMGLIASSLLFSSFSLYDLTCESAENPVGMDRTRPSFSWKINSPERGFTQSAYQIVVSLSPDFSRKDIVWNSRKVRTSRSIMVSYEGDGLQPFRKYYWKVRIWKKSGGKSSWSETQSFATGPMSTSDWGDSKWIALEQDKPEDYLVPGLHTLAGANKTLKGRIIGLYRMPQFRKEISVGKTVSRAEAYVSGLGHFDFFLNGKKVGDNFLDPGWMKYDKEALYVTFDVTEELQQGKNVLGVMLGNGFYNIPNERYFKLVTSFGAPKLKMMMRIEYSDGTVENVVSDESWMVTESPITYSSIYGGEDYDATKVQKGWKENGFDDASWKTPEVSGYSVSLISQLTTPLKVHSEIPVVRMFRNEKGWLYDLGQNFSGIVKIKLNSTSSQSVLLRPAELLNPDNTTNQSASGDPFYFTYTTEGKEGECWQPQFTYYGFRYVQVEGAVPAGTDNPAGLPEIVELKGVHTCNSAEEAGSFECSKPMFNQIHNLIDWAIRSNMASVQTDCPHREKLGWLEQTHLMQASLQYRYDLHRMYWKIMEDMAASQREDGCIPTIAPEYVRFENGFEDTPEWGSAFIISPWYIYKWYGDKRMIETYYPKMKLYIDYLSSRAEDNIIAYGLGDWFDIGPGTPGYAQLTSNGVTATAIYYYDVTIMQQIAVLLGETEDAAGYSQLASEIKKSFNDRFFDEKTGRIERNSQTASGMPLYVGLVDDGDRDRVLQNLVDDIRSRNNALTAGDIGYRYVLRSLEEGGRSDVIYDMNSKYDVPGYGWQLAHGATALTESWQAYGFISNNHFMLGHLMEWLYSGLGGIRQSPSSVAWSEVVIDPQVVGDVTSARTSYESPYGRIFCEWKDSADEYEFTVTVPANVSAQVVLPCPDASKVTEFGRPIARCKDVSVASLDPDRISVKIGSGTYSFTVEK